MKSDRHRNRRARTDPTGWLLGSTIVVLAVLDLLIWATLWNVPNPISSLVLPQTEATGGRGADDGAFPAAPPPAPASAARPRAD